MLTKEKIIQIADKNGEIRTMDIASSFGVSRQYVSSLLRELVASGALLKIGTTRNSFYVLPKYAKIHPEIFPNKLRKKYANHKLEEHTVLEEIEKAFPNLLKLPENIYSIFSYAFSEMLNNAIEHSTSKQISIEVTLENQKLNFQIEDYGVGVFRNIMQKRHLNSELEAIQDLLKGKTTTMPKSHSGEGIFFTSKASELFMLESFGHELIVDNSINDIFLKALHKQYRGTRVTFQIAIDTPLHLSDIFRKYSNISEGGDYGFDKTEIKIKLYTIGGVYVSRSQARRVLEGLNKFSSIVFDFDKVPMIGQAFADEIFRVFQRKHPRISISHINANESVAFMINRVEI